MLTTVRVSPRPVAVMRILLGLGALLVTLEGAVMLAQLQDDRITTPVAPWLPSASDVPLAVWTVVAVVACLGLTTGVATPGCALLAAGCDTLLMLSDLQLYSNHRVLQVLLCLVVVVAQADRALAPGAARRRRSSPTVRWWPQLLALGVVSSCYLFAGLSKLNPVFLAGSEVDELRWITVPPELLTPFAVLVVATEVGIGVGLWFRRTRHIAVAAGLGLHLSISLLLPSPFVFVAFALLCISVYPLALTRPDLGLRARVRPAGWAGA